MITAIAILGPTASGKSRLAMHLAQRAGGEILSIDSRQAYRHLDIGTAKPSAEDRRTIPHHLIDILDLREKNSAALFASMAHEAVRAVASRGRLPIFVGGSGLYFRALRHGFFTIKLDAVERTAFAESLRGIPDDFLFRRLETVDPESARRIHRNDRYRIVRALEVYSLTGTPLSAHMQYQRPDPLRQEIRFVAIGVDIPRAELHRNIHERTRMMFEGGWVEETEKLLAEGADPEWPGMKTLGYPEIVALLEGKSTLDETATRIVELTRQYAKRQVTWFQKEPDVAWFTGGAQDIFESAFELVCRSAGGTGPSG
jgi:tRNA dimethylallyltransferase